MTTYSSLTRPCWTDRQLEPQVKVSDFPEARSCPLDLPGGTLAVIDRVTERTDLRADAHPFYVPSYRLPHSQRAVVQDMISDTLDEGVIQESHSPSNSPLFLVPKRMVRIVLWLTSGNDP